MMVKIFYCFVVNSLLPLPSLLADRFSGVRVDSATGDAEIRDGWNIVLPVRGDMTESLNP